MKNVRVFIIYEFNPEDTKFYYMSVNEKDYERIKRCHGLMLNASGLTEEEEDTCNWLADFLDEHPLDKVNYESGAPFLGAGVDFIVHTGILL